MKQKTMKQKCLEMWEWLAENPTKDKIDYYDYLMLKGKINEFVLCWACQYAEQTFSQQKYIDNDCIFCPIKWFPEANGQTNDCCDPDSPYEKWDTIPYDDINRKKYAEQVVHLIKTTWRN